MLRTSELAIGCALAVLPAPSGAADTLGGHVAAMTDYVFRGVSQTRGAAAIQGDLHYLSPAGWAVGGWASTIDSNPGPGASLELNLYAAWNRSIGETWNARLAAVHYAYPNDSRSVDYDYDELVASLVFNDRLAATVAWSPNTTRYAEYRVAEDRTAVSYDLVGHWPIDGPFLATGSVGYYDLDDLFGAGYGYWSAGVSIAMSHLKFDFGYYEASDRAERWFGSESAGGRWSLAAAWHF